MRLTQLIKLFTLIVVITFSFSACTKSEDSNLQVFNRGNGTELQDLDPHIVTGVPEHHVIISVLEGLVSVDPKTVDPIPGVAKSWKISKKRKSLHL